MVWGFTLPVDVTVVYVTQNNVIAAAIENSILKRVRFFVDFLARRRAFKDQCNNHVSPSSSSSYGCITSKPLGSSISSHSKSFRIYSSIPRPLPY